MYCQQWGIRYEDLTKESFWELDPEMEKLWQRLWTVELAPESRLILQAICIWQARHLQAPTIRRIAHMTDMSVETVQRWITELEKESVLTLYEGPWYDIFLAVVPQKQCFKGCEG